MEKAYKLLAIQLDISNSQAKDLIDRGLVSVKGKKLTIARGELPKTTVFKVQEQPKIEKIFEDDNILALNKPAYMTSEDVQKQYPSATLLHRLDKETSGVLLLVKNEEFRLKAISEFKHKRVYKEYIALVDGVIAEPITIDSKIEVKKGKVAKSMVSKNGKDALTMVEPLELYGKRTKVKVVITTGLTHQIRVHLSSIGYPIFGDTLYGGKEASRVMLHSHKIELFNYKFSASLPKEFAFYCN